MEIPGHITREELVALHEKFREIKHSINNSLAVLMALSELAQRNAAQYEKLGKTVLTRGPDIVNQLQEFQGLLYAKIKPDAGNAPSAFPIR
jgi:two-component sensor histidine kinase